MRLTKRKTVYPRCDKQGNLTKVDCIEITNKGLAEEKLCQLEDIEEELGIDLVFITSLKTFFYKAEGNTVYQGEMGKNHYEGDDGSGTCETYIDFVNKCIHIADFWGGWDYVGDTELYFKDYGKTWALTKEELL